jgi:hypothetical protein
MGFPEADSWRCSSRPLIFGICMSAIRQEVRRTLRELKNSSADANTSTLNPNDFMRPPYRLTSQLIVVDDRNQGLCSWHSTSCTQAFGVTTRCDPRLRACCCPQHLRKDDADSGAKRLYFGLDRAAARGNTRFRPPPSASERYHRDVRVASGRGDQLAQSTPACHRVSRRPGSRPTQIALPSLSLRFRMLGRRMPSFSCLRCLYRSERQR